MPPRPQLRGPPVLLVWPPGRLASAIAARLGKTCNVCSAPSVELGAAASEHTPVVGVVDGASALLGYDELKRLVDADPAFQILAVGASANHFADLGDAVRLIPDSSSDLPAQLAAHLSCALGRRSLLLRVEHLSAALKATEQQRAELTQRFTELVEEMQDVVFEFDRQGRVLAVNQACSAIVGYTKTEAGALRIRDIVGTDAVTPMLLEMLSRDSAGGKNTQLLVAHRRTGQPFLAELSMSPVLHDGVAIGGRAVLRDVGVRNRTEEQLRHLADFYWTISSTLDRGELIGRIITELPRLTGVAHHGLFLFDPEDERLVLQTSAGPDPVCSVAAGPEADNLLALCLRPALRAPQSEAAAAPPVPISDASASACPTARVLGPAMVPTPICCHGSGGCRETRGAQCRLAAVLQGDVLLVALISAEAPVGVLSLSGPDGDEWQTPSNLAHFALIAQYVSAALNNTSLHAQLGARAGELERTLFALQTTRDKLVRSERLAAFSEIAMGVSHELRNPLNAISLMLYNLRDELANPDPQDGLSAAAERVSPILGEVLGLKQTLDSLLAVARQAPDPPAELDLNAAIRAVLETLQPQLEAQEITVRLQLAPELHPVAGDLADFRRALINLIVNATDAMGGPGTLTLRSANEGDDVCCHVADTGPGVSPTDREHIFSPFFTTKTSGTGLGLSLVQRVVTDMGGSVMLTEEPTEGAEFVLRFPPAIADHETQVPGPPAILLDETAILLDETAS